MKWTLKWDEILALQELAGGVCVEPGDSVWERLIEKGLAVPDEGLVRSSVTGEVVLDALQGQVLEPDRITFVTLVEEPWTEPEPASRRIDDFF